MSIWPPNPFANTGILQQPMYPPPPSEFVAFQRIRLKHIKEMLGQLNQDATGIHLLMAEKKAIEEFLGEPA